MNYKQAFTFIFEDEKWLSKVLIGIGLTLISILVIPMFISLGYLIEIAEKVIRKEKGLPEWNNWGQKILKGLTAMVLWLFLVIPIAILIFIPLIIFAREFFAANSVTVMQVFTTLTSAFLIPLVIVHIAGTHDKKTAFKIKEFFVIYKNNISRLMIVALLNLLLAAVTYFLQIFTEGLLTPYISNALGVSFIIGIIVSNEDFIYTTNITLNTSQ